MSNPDQGRGGESDEEAAGEADDVTAGKADDSATGETGRPCPYCGAPMRHRHCKYVCPRHGVVYACSDTFY